MQSEPPKLIDRIVRRLSNWVGLVETNVLIGGKIELFHSFELADYVVVCATTQDGRIPLVGQYRPAVQQITWEFPSGMVDPGELAIDAATRELHEETGLRVQEMTALGSYWTDPGRLANRAHIFFAIVEGNVHVTSHEPDLSLRFIDLKRLASMISAGEISSLPQVAAYHLARANLERFVHQPAAPTVQKP